MKSVLAKVRIVRWVPEFLAEARDTYRADGARGVIKRYGWKILALLFVYYLIRDSILYLLIPYLIARGFSS